jgi:hypothetical protein
MQKRTLAHIISLKIKLRLHLSRKKNDFCDNLHYFVQKTVIFLCKKFGICKNVINFAMLFVTKVYSCLIP